jgi:exonuclease SbcC
MIPILLRITGFLSYQLPVELDFSTFNLACISGPNGAGKSSILDAITWVLFGQARKRDESVINSHKDVKAAEVVFTFIYEDQIYKIQRILPRGKSSMLDFQIKQTEGYGKEGIWRSLSEHSIKETQARILQVLRLDYDTFINAAFFLQGKADQFAQQPPGKRKEILGSILGLEVWETYRERAFERRKTIERDMASKDGQMQEITAELSEEAGRKKNLQDLNDQLEGLTTARKQQESIVEKMKQLSASIQQQHMLVDTLKEGLERISNTRNAMVGRLIERESERDRFAYLLENSMEVDQSYSEWLKLRADLENFESVAMKFREQDKTRQSFLERLSNEQSRLEQEKKELLEERTRIRALEESLPALEDKIGIAQTELIKTEERLSEKEKKNNEIKQAREHLSEIRIEMEKLKHEMEELKERIDHLKATEGATCPLCGQPLGSDDRQKLIDQLESRGTELGNRFRENKSRYEKVASEVESMEKVLTGLASTEDERLKQTTILTQFDERKRFVYESVNNWINLKATRLKEIQLSLQEQTFLPEFRNEISNLDLELANVGYDANAHQEVKKSELEARNAEINFHNLSSAKAAMEPLINEVENLKKQVENLDLEISRQSMELAHARAVLSKAEEVDLDLDGSERVLLDLQERENRLNQEVGAARQKVAVLKDLRHRMKRVEAERENLAVQIRKIRILENAFGKDGIPALLIEQALPEIENRANEMLDRLSDGAMTVRFSTQSAYKDKKRNDLKETMDILISDGAGVRDYELFSGGEAFKVNFAIRLALSEVLSHRKGARLQTLVIDEGFGSQDALGRQRLIEAINAVQSDFAKVLVITHLDELKDAFQTRIEVTKTENGSSILVN